MGKVKNNSNRRRLRTPNWSPEEKQYLLELIKARKEVVVTKSNNGPNFSEEKSIAWNEILVELETRFGAKFVGSPIKKVKTQWQNMKRLAREEIAQTGPMLHKLTRQTVEVCQILDMVKDGVLQIESQNLNETARSTNVEIKTERIDEDMNQAACNPSEIKNSTMAVDIESNKENLHFNPLESSGSSASEQVSEMNESGVSEEASQSNSFKKNASATTDDTNLNDPSDRRNPFHKEMQDYFKFISAEKLMKMEAIKEERQVIRAMRETAELNKIIAEQKLKHVLWIKKTEMA